MRHIRIAVIAALALPLAACGWRRTPVPVIAEAGSTALLVGAWSGDYRSKETGRSGSITFDMASEKDTAYCDVVMVPAASQTFQVVTRERPDVPTVRQPLLPEPLKIRFIRLGENRVTGTLDPYTDPECGCSVTTTFEGTFTDGNTIEGTYITRGAAPARSSKGVWKVTRKASTVSVK